MIAADDATCRESRDHIGANSELSDRTIAAGAGLPAAEGESSANDGSVFSVTSEADISAADVSIDGEYAVAMTGEISFSRSPAHLPPWVFEV